MAAAASAARRNVRHEKAQHNPTPTLPSVAPVVTVNLPDSKDWIGHGTLEMLMLNGLVLLRTFFGNLSGH